MSGQGFDSLRVDSADSLKRSEVRPPVESAHQQNKACQRLGFDDLDYVAPAPHSVVNVKYLKFDVTKNLQGK